MEFYLIRHTAPMVERGICYGQSDLDITESFYNEAAIIQQHLPAAITAVYSSPLQRCRKLAEHLFAGHPVHLLNDLKEIDCGQWEMRFWKDIPKEETDIWMNDLINVCIPGGESYTGLFARVVACFNRIVTLHSNSTREIPGNGANNLPGTVIVAHGGVIRSILSHITRTSLLDSFKLFSLHYGCVVKIIHDNGILRYEILSNIPHEKEMHKPSHL